MSNKTALNSERVETIFMECLFQEGEDTTGYIPALGIRSDVRFHPQRLQSHRQEIEAMLYELPNEFKKSSGGGSSFLHACNDKHGNQWTDLHQRMEQLVQLGFGIGKVQYQLPRAMWSFLPGGMPYIVID